MDWQATLAQWLDEDWVRYLLSAVAAVALAIVSWHRERRRKLRSNPDAVPWLPWRDIAFWSSFAALLLLGAAFQAWLKA